MPDPHDDAPPDRSGGPDAASDPAADPAPDPASGPALSPADTAAIRQAKRTLRAAVLQRRAVRPRADRDRADHARTTRVQEFLGDLARPGLTVAAHLSAGDEPATLELISWLVVRGLRVLLPVVGGAGHDLPRDDSGRRAPAWAVYTGPDGLQPGRYGIAEPSGAVLGADALAGAHLVILPGLAGNAYGHRLGRGGGWYDRALGDSDAVRLLLLNDDEVMPAIPVEPTDRHVDVIITDTRTVNCTADTSGNPDY